MLSTEVNAASEKAASQWMVLAVILSFSKEMLILKKKTFPWKREADGIRKKNYKTIAVENLNHWKIYYLIWQYFKAMTTSSIC